MLAKIEGKIINIASKLADAEEPLLIPHTSRKAAREPGQTQSPWNSMALLDNSCSQFELKNLI
ncbi:hypothetical protein [Mesorhizobium wenxiniae]|uniref:hypothetical protein n=1 Tax=Mesorhizobium wenxiniae TaxID=2014805 RepID=UPI0010563039|nr:hypothetical protein [Mesorhizobium wenxiniae]